MRSLFCPFLLFLLSPLGAQVVNTAQTLRPGTLALAVNPLVVSRGGNNDLALFAYADFGLRPGLDLSLRAGFGEAVAGSDTWWGADLEWLLRRAAPYVSLALGGHFVRDPGLDGTLLLSFPLSHNLDFYSGLDLDLQFGDSRGQPLWWPIGVEIAIRRKLSFLLEADIPLSDDAANLAGAALKLYF